MLLPRLRKDGPGSSVVERPRSLSIPDRLVARSLFSVFRPTPARLRQWRPLSVGIPPRPSGRRGPVNEQQLLCLILSCLAALVGIGIGYGAARLVDRSRLKSVR